jgi:hypothetical protein
MIGIARTFFWLFLIIFSVSAIYSLKDIRLNYGQPQITLKEDDEILLSLPIAIVNPGYYDLDRLNISARVSDKQGLTTVEGFTFIPLIGRDATVNITHLMTLNMTEILRDHQDFLYNDTELQANVMVTMTAAKFIPIQVSSNLSIPWGAPLYNLTLGSPVFSSLGGPDFAAQYKVTIPISFDNHAFFDLEGIVQAKLYNDANTVIEKGEIDIKTPQHSQYHGNLELNIPVNLVTRSGHFEVFFKTPLFDFGPLEVFYGN